MINQTTNYAGTFDRPIPPSPRGGTDVRFADVEARVRAEQIKRATEENHALGLPVWSYRDEWLPTGLHRFFHMETPIGSQISALRYVGVEATAEDALGAPSSAFGDAVQVSGVIAEDACTGSWVSTAPGSDAGDVFDMLTPGGDVAGITATLYAQFKSPPNAELWKYEPANGAGYFKCNSVNQAKLSPIPGSSTTTTTTNQGMSTGAKIALGVGALALVVGGAVLATR